MFLSDPSHLLIARVIFVGISVLLTGFFIGFYGKGDD